jgi:cytochrome c-type biogenesis protein CcmH/NrfF
MTKSLRWSRMVLAAAVLLASPAAFGQQVQERPNADVARRAIGQLRSPYCPGFMLETCTSSAAAALRDSIYDLAEQGVPSGDIVEWMLDRHGEEWRAVPQRSGAGVWAWVIPPLALLAGLAIIVGWLRSSRSAEEARPPVDSRLTDTDREELAHALREWQDAGEEEI